MTWTYREEIDEGSVIVRAIPDRERVLVFERERVRVHILQLYCRQTPLVGVEMVI